MAKFAQPGDFCPNPAGPDYGQPHHQNIQKFGKTRAGIQRYRCRTCRKTFTATYGTIFYRKRTPEHEILAALALLAAGSRISSVARVKGFKEDTILAWLRAAGQHAEQVEAVLLKEYHVQRGQLDALWTYVGHKEQKKRP